ncbi:MAG: hypothetical protein B6U89_02680 [Desulfurococcales archaeon ex4484_58]|nr:MAG: hypothetical protein B6U89_02680 [Desulfurococcales archaeon ex4484_58]
MKNPDKIVVHKVYIPYISYREAEDLYMDFSRRLKGNDYDLFITVNTDPFSVTITSTQTRDTLYLIFLGMDLHNNTYIYVPILVGPLSRSDKDLLFRELRRKKILYYEFDSDKNAHFLKGSYLNKVLQNTPSGIGGLGYILREMMWSCSSYKICTENFSRILEGLAIKAPRIHYKLIYHENDKLLKLALRVSKNKTTVPLLQLKPLSIDKCREYEELLFVSKDLFNKLSKYITQKIPPEYRGRTHSLLLHILNNLITKKTLISVLSGCRDFRSKKQENKCINILCEVLKELNFDCITNYSIIIQLIDFFKEERI